MSRIAYVNGRYVPHREAVVHVEDRGYQFADGVYEVCEVFHGVMMDEERHLDRLERSLRELRIAMPVEREALEVILREVVARNRIKNGIVYLQVTRGVARRDHPFPKTPVRPALVVTAKSHNLEAMDAMAAQGVAVIEADDDRWSRVDIKTVSLLPNVLAKQEAVEAGAREAWLVDDDGFVTEGASTNAWIVTKDGVLITRPAEFGILRGITRTTLMDVLEAHQIRYEERPFTIEEAQNAAEAFITSATSLVLPVVKVAGHPVGQGRPGPIATSLRQKLREELIRSAQASRLADAI
jgi:D-alanine transaminase